MERSDARGRTGCSGCAAVTTGLVIGKFLPPHRGHKYLIDTACAAVDTVDVIVCQRDDDRLQPNCARRG